MISPTKLGMRGNDKWGSGLYGASRGGRKHRGADFICIPGQEVWAPTRGMVVRIAYPYAEPYKDIMYSGILIEANDCAIKMFYFEPLKTILKTTVEEGQLVGHAQDISVRYPGMIPHVHLEILSMNPELFIRLP